MSTLWQISLTDYKRKRMSHWGKLRKLTLARIYESEKHTRWSRMEKGRPDHMVQERSPKPCLVWTMKKAFEEFETKQRLGLTSIFKRSLWLRGRKWIRGMQELKRRFTSLWENPGKRRPWQDIAWVSKMLRVMKKYPQTRECLWVTGVKEESWDSGLLACHSQREVTWTMG